MKPIREQDESGMEVLKHAIIESHRYQAKRECEQEVIDKAREFFHAILNGEPLPVVVGRQSRLEKAFARLDEFEDATVENAEVVIASSSDTEELLALREAAVTLAIPYEALLLDSESRKWIAPEVWTAIENAVAQLRKALGK